MAIAYENQLLGAFIYALGYEAGRHGADAVAVNLLQQTPLDGTFGDLIAGSTHCLALEFKRTKQDVVSERKKWSADALRNFSQDADAVRISPRAHFLCFGQQRDTRLELIGMTYAHALGISEKSAPGSLPIQRLISAIVLSALPGKDARKLGAAPQVLERYLRTLRTYRIESTGSAGAKGDSAWVAIAQAEDGYQFMVAESLELLLDRDLERDQRHEHKLERERDRGGPSR